MQNTSLGLLQTKEAHQSSFISQTPLVLAFDSTLSDHRIYNPYFLNSGKPLVAVSRVANPIGPYCLQILKPSRPRNMDPNHPFAPAPPISDRDIQARTMNEWAFIDEHAAAIYERLPQTMPLDGPSITLVQKMAQVMKGVDSSCAERAIVSAYTTTSSQKSGKTRHRLSLEQWKMVIQGIRRSGDIPQSYDGGPPSTAVPWKTESTMYTKSEAPTGSSAIKREYSD